MTLCVVVQTCDVVVQINIKASIKRQLTGTKSKCDEKGFKPGIPGTFKFVREKKKANATGMYGFWITATLDWKSAFKSNESYVDQRHAHAPATLVPDLRLWTLACGCEHMLMVTIFNTIAWQRADGMRVCVRACVCTRNWVASVVQNPWSHKALV